MQQFRRLRAYLIGAVVGALLMLSGAAVAQSLQVKHFGCWGPGPRPDKTFTYLPNGADLCPTGWNKIDWVDD